MKEKKKQINPDNLDCVSSYWDEAVTNAIKEKLEKYEERGIKMNPVSEEKQAPLGYNLTFGTPGELIENKHTVDFEEEKQILKKKIPGGKGIWEQMKEEQLQQMKEQHKSSKQPSKPLTTADVRDALSWWAPPQPDLIKNVVISEEEYEKLKKNQKPEEEENICLIDVDVVSQKLAFWQLGILHGVENMNEQSEKFNEEEYNRIFDSIYDLVFSCRSKQ